MPAKKKAAGLARRPEPSHAIQFAATLVATPFGRSIARLPEAASKALPSRGQVAVDADIRGRAFRTVIEPDGEFGHWMSLDAEVLVALGLEPGDDVHVALAPSSVWPEPEVPADLSQALSMASPEVKALWAAITPMARWEWVRWVNETKSMATRKKRIDVSLSKLSAGKRRPCCFNLASCTDPELAKSGRLSMPR